MVIKEFFSVPILSVVAGSSVAFRSPVVERFHCIVIIGDNCPNPEGEARRRGQL